MTALLCYYFEKVISSVIVENPTKEHYKWSAETQRFQHSIFCCYISVCMYFALKLTHPISNCN